MKMRRRPMPKIRDGLLTIGPRVELVHDLAYKLIVPALHERKINEPIRGSEPVVGLVVPVDRRHQEIAMPPAPHQVLHGIYDLP